VLTRRLSLKLLAPTVLVSLLLVGTCVAGVLYLNWLHVTSSRIHTENVESTQAAAQLETTVSELLVLLRSNRQDPDALAEHLPGHLGRLRVLLDDCEHLANLQREQQLVKEIDNGLTDYLTHWQQRGRSLAALAARMIGLLASESSPQPLVTISALTVGRTVEDAALATLLDDKVLTPCRELRLYNLSQVGSSDRANADLVNRLTWMLLAVGVGAPLGGLVLGYAVARSLYQSMCQLSVHIRDAAGRLSGEVKPVTLETPDDLQDLSRQMQDVLKEIERVVEQLQQRDREVQRADQLAAVGQVAAGVAHELRNPLTSVKMLVQNALEEQQVSGLPREDLAIIEQEVRRMESCIQTFIDFARPPKTERRRTDLLAVVRRALALIDGRAQRQKVVIKTDLPPGPVDVLIDAEQIHQVLLNLLLNALDVLPQGGQVELYVRPELGGTGVTVRLRDNGPGIAPEMQQRLFEPFVSSKETGLGLGLSICRRLLEAHGGAIHGCNAASGGAVFTFTLPG
jgi:two-component system, NtrC family, sensor histidine kinase HydH